MAMNTKVVANKVWIIFLIDKQQKILEKAKKLHVYRGYTQKPKTKS